MPSALLELPAELRVQIFEYVLQGARCQRPLFILESVYVQSDARSPPKNTAILLACRATYKECLPLLYDQATVEMSLRDEQDANDVRASVIDLGTIEDCSLLSRLRHIELEIPFNAFDDASVARAATRMHRLSDVVNQYGSVKTHSLTFLQSGGHFRDDGSPCDALVEQAVKIRRIKLLEVSRNMAARYAISTSRWTALRRLAADYNEAEPERFHEISLDYWNRVFPNKDQSSSSD